MKKNVTDILDIHTHKLESRFSGKIYRELSAVGGLSIVYAFRRRCGSG